MQVLNIIIQSDCLSFADGRLENALWEMIESA